MKIGIVGGGWVGCHLASKLNFFNHSITLYEKEESLFTKTSYNNQNRLHLGYHYPRSSKTRELCQTTFLRFMQDYGKFTSEIPKNYYCVANSSHIDFNTYKKIFDVVDDDEVILDFENVEGTINTSERHINFQALNEYFNSTLNNLVARESIVDLNSLSEEYDFVINCTNNFLSQRNNSFYELTITLLYDKINATQFDSVTLVDGDFFSIFPYKNNLYTLTDVEHTPIKSSTNLVDIENIKIDDTLLSDKIDKMQQKVLFYYPSFLNDFKYSGYYTSIKSKSVNSHADRSPIIERENNILHCYTGKIQGIYSIESFIREHVL